MLRTRLKTILLSFTILLTLLIISGVGFAVYSFVQLENEMARKLQSKKYLEPTEYYTAPLTFKIQSTYSPKDVENEFVRRFYRKRSADQRLLSGDYKILSAEQCSFFSHIEDKTLCLQFVHREALSDDHPTTMVFVGAKLQEVLTSAGEAHRVELEPLLFAQYIEDEPVTQITKEIGEIPALCLQAILAIEDEEFLEHGGVSIKGIARAVLKNLSSGRKAQGGSTITQQLVKNYFLTSERTFRRKFKEFVMSILLESRFSKDEILETYLNVIYMGQNGTFQIRGYGAASRYYFNKNLENVDTDECALLAAIVNSPGLYNPFRKPENAFRRRNLVLDKMHEQKILSKEQLEEAQARPLPSENKAFYAAETAPYFIDAVKKQSEGLKIPLEGHKVYTSLNLRAQEAAQNAVQKHIENLEKNSKSVKKHYEAGNKLEGLLVSADNETGLVQAVVGGRNFKTSQYNRVIQSHRQIGSIMKPLVFLTALINYQPDGAPYTPITLVDDSKVTHRYEGQKWTPVNYGGKYYGTVPMFYALKNSLNSATANLGLAVGLGNIAEVARMVGIHSPLQTLPSMTLGSFELYPTEVLTTYMTFANMGVQKNISYIRQIYNHEGEEIFSFKPEAREVIDPLATASLVSMMKQTVQSGTARSIVLNGFIHPAAGKTGTTSDHKDAWFAGFTKFTTTVTWVGYDNNLPHGLTGSSGAVPIWTQYMKAVASHEPEEDFAWPEDSELRVLGKSDLEKLNALQENDPEAVEVVFDKNKVPNF